MQKNIRLTIVGILLIIGAVLIFFTYSVMRERPMSSEEMKRHGAYIFEYPRQVADFELKDHNGKVFSPEELKNKWTLMFFGFTFCPDVCPTTLAEMNKMMGMLSEKYQVDTQLVFVSVDPVRDALEKVKAYVEYFNPKFVGVTGDFLALKRFATEVNVPFAKVPGGSEENYLIEHGSNVVLINPDGEYAGFFKAPIEAAKLKLTYQSARLH